MSRKTLGLIGVTVLITIFGLWAGLYPCLVPPSPSGPQLDIDAVEGKAWIDSRVVIELRGHLDRDEVLNELQVSPAVPISETDIGVEHIARLPWHESFSWAKTRVTVNQHRKELFRPETTYALTLQGQQVRFDTISMPGVISAGPAHGPLAAPSDAVFVMFKGDIRWDSRYLVVDPALALQVRQDAENRTLTITPSPAWLNSTVYAITIKKGLPDRFGHPLANDFVFRFTTLPPVGIVGVSPTGEHLPGEVAVRVSFDRAPVHEAAERSLAITPAVRGALSWENETTLSWTAASPNYSTTFNVAIGGDAARADPIVPRAWQFRTQDPPVGVEIQGGNQSPAVLKAAVSGGTGSYSYQWSTGQTDEQITVNVPVEEAREIGVTVSSGDQAAGSKTVVLGPPACPAGWQKIVIGACFKTEELPGPVKTFVARIDLKDPKLELTYRPAAGALGNATPASSAGRGALVSVNGDFFDYYGGRYFTIGPMASGGSFIYQTERPWPALAIGRDHSSWIGTGQDLAISITAPSGASAGVQRVNDIPGADQLAIFNSYWGATLSLPMEGCYAIAAPVDGQNNSVASFSCGPVQDIPLKQGQFVVVGIGAAAEWMKSNLVEAFAVSPHFPFDVDILVGGSQALIADGQPVALKNELRGRNPRTAIGVDGQGFVYMVVVEGRTDASIGMDLDELQSYLGRFGIVNAINLDGGGSSTMVVQGSVVNRPSDGVERPVAAVIDVRPRSEGCWQQFIHC